MVVYHAFGSLSREKRLLILPDLVGNLMDFLKDLETRNLGTVFEALCFYLIGCFLMFRKGL